MKYTQDERLQIGQLVYTNQLFEAATCLKYNIGRTCIQNYMRTYKQTNGIRKIRRESHKKAVPWIGYTKLDRFYKVM